MEQERTGSLTVLATSGSAALRPGSRPQVESFARTIRDHLEELLTSQQFDGASRSRDFLTFIVEETLAGRGQALNQAVIATRVFGRKGDFDAILDPVVRVQAGRLRRSLERFYLLTGNKSAVRIELPKGCYTPVFTDKVTQEADARLRVKRISLSLVAPEWPVLLIGHLDTAGAGDRSIAARIEDELAMEIARYGDVRVIRQRDLERLDLPYQASVRFELRGNLRTAGADVIVTVSLIDRSSGEQAWSDEYHSAAPDQICCSPDDIPLVIAARIASENGVIVRLLASEHGGEHGESSRSVDAIVSCYHFFFSRQLASLNPAIEALKRSTVREPEVALGWLYLSRLYQINHAFELLDRPTSIDAAIGYAYQAVLLEPRSARIRCILAACLVVKGELGAARDELDRALHASRGSLAYREIIGWLLSLSGDWERGVPLMHDALARNPYCLSHVRHGLWADALRRGQFDEAYVAALEYPDRVFFWRDLMITSCLGLLGRTQEARASAAELLRIKPDFARRGRTLIGHYIKSPELRERIAEGCRKAGIVLLN
ncbi:MAG TPA: hypothetical protein PKE27_13135 [Povalibacter sp.]|nr:hypothetical protein [Povalibacter sp.]